MLSSLVQRAQSIIDQTPLASNHNDRHPSKAALFREQFRLPESQHPIAEISAELTIPVLNSPAPQQQSQAAAPPAATSSATVPDTASSVSVPDPNSALFDKLAAMKPPSTGVSQRPGASPVGAKVQQVQANVLPAGGLCFLCGQVKKRSPLWIAVYLNN